MKTYLSYGAGVNSTALLVLHENRIDEAIFVDHGGDYPETYDYVRYMEKQGFPITILKPDVEGFNDLYDFCMHKKIIPSRLFRWCTHKFKINPIINYVDIRCKMWIGFCVDERKRVKSEFRYRKEIYNSYPLISEGITRAGCIEIIKEAGLKIPIKSCCFFCPFMKKKEARQLYLHHPELFEKCKILEANCMRNDIFIKDDSIAKIAMEGVRLDSWVELR